MAHHEPRGFYPLLDSVYSGGGFAAGLGARTPIGDNGAINVIGAYSINSFWRTQTDVTLPSFASDRGRVTLTADYLDAPDVKYYGIGQDSAKDAKTFFGAKPFKGGGRVDFGVSRYLSVGGGVNYLDIKTDSGATGPSIGTRFSPADSPGLELDEFKYVNSTARAVVDWRRQLGYSGSGGQYRVQFDDFRERDNDQYSFRSLEGEVTQMIPLMRANWVIALRGLATVTDVDDTAAVPFFMLPSLGGGKTLRGYPDFRFRDRNRLVMNAELRWTPARFLDMALFYDAGKVDGAEERPRFPRPRGLVRDRHAGYRCERVRIQGRRRAQPGARRASSHHRGRSILMVSSKQRRQGLVALGCVFAVAMTAGAVKNGQKFYPDDPIAQIVDAEDASGVQEREIDLEYDTLENLFSWPGDQTPNVRAQNVNTIDEVPDSTWFTNRLGTRARHGRRARQGTRAGHGPGAWRLDGDRGQERRRHAGVHDARFRGEVAGSSSSIRQAIPRWRPAPRSSSPGCSGRSAITCRRTHLATLRPED